MSMPAKIMVMAVLYCLGYRFAVVYVAAAFLIHTAIGSNTR